MISQTVTVELGDRSYPIWIGRELLAHAGSLCVEQGLSGLCMIVSDSHVAPLYMAACKGALEGAGFAVETALVPAGEPSKSQQQLFALYDQALACGLDRKSIVVALGGGVIGDLAGYLAASYLRGIRFVQIPTSLLAMVDSSVGGKTGINLPQGKNLVGAFHQPEAVCADMDVLRTLPRREYVSGLAEVVKYGVIYDAEFFGFLEECADGLLACDLDVVSRVVARCCEIKAEVVRQDEREAGLRAILNFGHTLGHAIENAGGYGVYLHGEAVAMGMAYAAWVSVRETGLQEADARRIVRLLRRLELPVEMPACRWEDLQRAMTLDKKVSGGVPRFVLAETLGVVNVSCTVEERALRQVYETINESLREFHDGSE
ncbi:MAG: 3-dehydroquinate synthase [Spartobacteria bacterium]|nr:3-dehydroquinate synthase [Spartobacteria bacterium]